MDNNFNNGNFDPNQNQFNGFGQPPVQPGVDQSQQFAQQAADQSQQFVQQAADQGQQFAQQAADQSQQFAQQAADQSQQFAQQAADQGQQFAQQAQTGGFSLAGQDMNQQFAQINQQNQQQFGAVASGNFGGQNINNADNMGNMPNNIPNNIPPTKVKKPMSKGAIAGIIGGIAAVIALIVCGILFLPKLFDPKKKIEDAFEKTFSSGNSSDIVEKLQKDGGETQFTINVDSILGEDISSSLDYDMVINPNTKLLNMDAVLTITGDELMKLNMVADEDNTYIQIVDAIDGYIVLPNKGFGNALINAPLLSEAFDGVDVSSIEDLDLNYFEVVETVETEGGDVFDELWDKAEIKKKGKQSITVNGKSVKAKQYEITFPKDVVLDTFEDAFDEVLSNYDTSELGVTSGQIRSVLSMIIADDIVAQVYIADGKVVKFDCHGDGGYISYNIWMDYDDTEMSGEIALTAVGETISLEMDIKDPNGNPNGSATINIAGETVVLNFSSTVTSSSDEQKSDIKLDATYDGESVFEGSIVSSVNTKNNNPSGVDSSLKTYEITKMSEDEAVKMVEDNYYQLNEWISNFTSNELISELFYTGYNDYIDYDDYEDDYEWEDDYDYEDDDNWDDDDEEIDTLLESWDGEQVEILGSLDGLELWYGSGYSVSYEDPYQYFYADYMLRDADNVNEAIEYYAPNLEESDYYTYDILEQEDGSAIDFEDTTITYSKFHYIEKSKEYDYEDEYMVYVFARELKPGLYLVCEMDMDNETEWINKSTEDLVRALSSNYYDVK